MGSIGAGEGSGGLELVQRVDEPLQITPLEGQRIARFDTVHDDPITVSKAVDHHELDDIVRPLEWGIRMARRRGKEREQK